MTTHFTPEAWLEHMVSDADSQPTVVALPTTEAVLTKVSALKLPAIGRVGRAEYTPSQALARMASGHIEPLWVVYSDQLYSESDATVLVHFDEGSAFFSPTEYVMANKYGYKVWFWGADGTYTGMDGYTRFSEAMQIIHDHLIGCKALGEQWLEAHAQEKRSVTCRVRLARHYTRYLHSSIANAYKDAPEQALELIKTAQSKESQLKHLAS